MLFSSLQIALAPPLHSLVATNAVCLQHGAAMGTMTALMTATNTTVRHGYLGRVPRISSLVPTSTASLIPGAVTQTMTVGTVQMKPTVVSVPQRVTQKSEYDASNVHKFNKQIRVQLLSCILWQSVEARAIQDSSSVQTTAA